MTDQEMFDTVVAGLASQGFERSVSAGGSSCKYRGQNGRKCAAGWLIPDEVYSVTMEGNSIASVAQGLPTRVGSLIPNKRLASQLQVDHDYCRNAEDMRQRLKMTAVTFNLTIPQVLNA